MTSLGKIGVPSYLNKPLDSYRLERTLWYSTNTGSKQYTVTAGVAQGSVLSFLLWNVMYNRVLVLPVPTETTIIGFPDDLAAVIVSITNRRKMNTVNVRVGGHIITSKSVTEYLGVMIDAKINFKRYLEYAYEKAIITSDIGGSKYSHRLLVAEDRGTSFRGSTSL